MSRTLLAALAVVLLIAGMALASQTVEGQVVKVDNWVLTVRTQAGETLELSPRWVQEGKSWLPARPARTILPALEAGEMVRVSWTMDEKENRRRIDSIEVTSPREGTLKETVVRATASELVVKATMTQEEAQEAYVTTGWAHQLSSIPKNGGTRDGVRIAPTPEKPGTVTLNTKYVQVEGKWVPDPQISRLIASLKAGDKLTVQWAWDQEGRKRIIAVSDIVKAPREGERERR